MREKKVKIGKWERMWRSFSFSFLSFPTLFFFSFLSLPSFPSFPSLSHAICIVFSFIYFFFILLILFLNVSNFFWYYAFNCFIFYFGDFVLLFYTLFSLSLSLSLSCVFVCMCVCLSPVCFLSASCLVFLEMFILPGLRCQGRH